MGDWYTGTSWKRKLEKGETASLDKGQVRAGRFCEHTRKHWRGMCERLQQGGSGTGLSVKRERGERSCSDLGGHNSVWSGETTGLGNREGKR